MGHSVEGNADWKKAEVSIGRRFGHCMRGRRKRHDFLNGSSLDSGGKGKGIFLKYIFVHAPPPRKISVDAHEHSA